VVTFSCAFLRRLKSNGTRVCHYVLVIGRTFQLKGSYRASMKFGEADNGMEFHK
jgi:hypothetical protein